MERKKQERRSKLLYIINACAPGMIGASTDNPSPLMFYHRPEAIHRPSKSYDTAAQIVHGIVRVPLLQHSHKATRKNLGLRVQKSYRATNNSSRVDGHGYPPSPLSPPPAAHCHKCTSTLIINMYLFHPPKDGL